MSDELVIIARFGSSIEAHEARFVLEEAEIEAVVSDEAVVTLFPNVIGLGGVQLLVSEADAGRAVELLQDTPADNDLEAHTEGHIVVPDPPELDEEEDMDVGEPDESV